jgi:hypothetical protein
VNAGHADLSIHEYSVHGGRGNEGFGELIGCWMRHTSGQDCARAHITFGAEGGFFQFSQIYLFFVFASSAVDGQILRRCNLKVEVVDFASPKIKKAPHRGASLYSLAKGTGQLPALRVP